MESNALPGKRARVDAGVVMLPTPPINGLTKGVSTRRTERTTVVGRTLPTTRGVVNVVEAPAGAAVRWLEEDEGVVLKSITGGTFQMVW